MSGGSINKNTNPLSSNPPSIGSGNNNQDNSANPASRNNRLQGAQTFPTHGIQRPTNSNNNRPNRTAALQGANANPHIQSVHTDGPRPTTFAGLEQILVTSRSSMDFFGVASAMRKAPDKPSENLLKLLTENFPGIYEASRNNQKNHKTLTQWTNIFFKADENNEVHRGYIKTLMQQTVDLISPRKDPVSDEEKDPQIMLQGDELSMGALILNRMSTMQGYEEIEPVLKQFVAATAWQIGKADLDDKAIGTILYHLRNTANTNELEIALKKLLTAIEPKIRNIKEGFDINFIGQAFLGLQSLVYTKQIAPKVNKVIDALLDHVEQATQKRQWLMFDHIIMFLAGIKPLPPGKTRDRVIAVLTDHLEKFPTPTSDKEWRKHLSPETDEQTNRNSHTILARMIEQLHGCLGEKATYNLVAQLFRKAGMRKPPPQAEVNIPGGFANLIYDILAPTIVWNSAHANAKTVDLHSLSLFVGQMFGNQALTRYTADDTQTHSLRLVPGRQLHTQHNRSENMWDVAKTLHAAHSSELIWHGDPNSEETRDRGSIFVSKALKPAGDFSGRLKDEQKSIDRGDGKKLEFSFGERPVRISKKLDTNFFLSDAGLWNTMRHAIAQNHLNEYGNPLHGAAPQREHEWDGRCSFEHRGARYLADYAADGKKIKTLRVLYQSPAEAGGAPPAEGIQPGKAVLSL